MVARFDPRDAGPPLAAQPSSYPRNHTEIFDRLTGRVLGHWDPTTQTVEDLDLLLDALYLARQAGGEDGCPDIHCLPSIHIPAAFESQVDAMDYRGMCMVAGGVERFVHIDKLRRRSGREWPEH